MKSNFKYLVPAIFVAAFAWIGCQSKLAPLTSLPTTSATYPVFIFPSSSTVEINPNLPIAGTNKVNGPGADCAVGCPVATFSYPVDIVVNQPATISGTACPSCSLTSPLMIQPTFVQSNVEPSGLTQYPYEVHVTGWIDDPETPLFVPGPGNYDSVYLRAWPNYPGASTYDVSIFQGIQFYIYVAPDDDAPSRQFQVPSLQNVPGPGAAPSGMCQNVNDPVVTHCYDPFYYDFTDIRKGEWVFIQKRWEDLKQFGNGTVPNPATFTGVNQQQAIYFGWVEGNSAQAGPFIVDFSVTGCSFF